MMLWFFIIVVLPFLIIAAVLKLQQHFEWPWLERQLVRLDQLSKKRRGMRVPVVEIIFIPLIALLIWGAFKHERSDWIPFNNRIAVLADSTEWTVLEPLVRQTFERVTRTPQPEHRFHVILPQDLEARKTRAYRYWVLLSTLQSQGPVHDIVTQEVLPGNAETLVDQGQYAFLSGGPWGFDQLVLSVLTPDLETLQGFLKDESDSLYAVIEGDAYLTLRHALYASKTERATAQMLADSAGWALEKQATLEVAEADYDAGFVGFSSYVDGRWAFVRWLENADPAWVNADWVRGERDRVTAQYFDSSYVSKYYLDSQKEDFLGRPAQITHGLWADDDPDRGGPFTNYTFYDTEDRRLYMIDVHVYASGKSKMQYLQPLEVVAHTFVTRQEYELRKLRR